MYFVLTDWQRNSDGTCQLDRTIPQIPEFFSEKDSIYYCTLNFYEKLLKVLWLLL